MNSSPSEGFQIMNVTNGTGERFSQPPNEETKAVITAAYTVLLLVALIANPFVIHVAYGNRLPTSPPFNLFITNLAICDILYAVLAGFVQIGYLYMGFTWFQGHFAVFLCKFKEFALVLVVSVSIYTLIVMATDRYFAIAHPLRRPMSRTNVQIAIALVWLISCLFSAPELYKYKTFTKPGQKTTFCISSWTSDPYKPQDQATLRVEFMTKLFLFYVIPLVTMATLYGIVISFLWKRSAPGVRIPNNQGNARRRFRKIILTLVSMVMVFALGWLPVHVVHLMSHFDRAATLQFPYVVFYLMFWTAHANCAVNPCLYFVFNKDYRDELRTVVQRYLPGCACLSFRSGLLNNRKAKYSFRHKNKKRCREEYSRGATTETQETKL